MAIIRGQIVSQKDVEPVGPSVGVRQRGMMAHQRIPRATTSGRRDARERWIGHEGWGMRSGIEKKP